MDPAYDSESLMSSALRRARRYRWAEWIKGILIAPYRVALRQVLMCELAYSASY